MGYRPLFGTRHGQAIGCSLEEYYDGPPQAHIYPAYCGGIRSTKDGDSEIVWESLLAWLSLSRESSYGSVTPPH